MSRTQAPLRSPQDILADWRRYRAHAVGMRLIGAGGMLAFAAALLDACYSPPYVVYGDLFTTIGCLVSLLWTRSIGRKDVFVWWPAYLAYWLDTNATIYSTGGMDSPFMGTFISLLCVSGLVIQTRLKPWTIFLFSALTYTGWYVAPMVLALPAHPAMPAIFVFSIRFIALFAIGVCLHAFLRTEQALSREVFARMQELSEARSELIHAAKMAELGNHVATAAHELAQPAQVISSASALLMRLAQSENASRERLQQIGERIRQTSGRLVALLERFREFSRKGAFDPRILDAREVIRSIEHLTQFDFRARNADYEIDLPEEPLEILADSTQVQQVLLNLLNNARDACAGLDGALISVKAAKEGDRVRIRVRDNGPGIPLGLQPRVFQSRFTTKESTTGTGLGLSICAQLIEQHEGRVFFCSEPGETVFLVDLPAAGVSAHSPVFAGTAIAN